MSSQHYSVPIPKSDFVGKVAWEQQEYGLSELVQNLPRRFPLYVRVVEGYLGDSQWETLTAGEVSKGGHHGNTFTYGEINHRENGEINKPLRHSSWGGKQLAGTDSFGCKSLMDRVGDVIYWGHSWEGKLLWAHLGR